jgi:hypothetical protein
METIVYHHYTYEGALEASARVNWQIADIIGGDKRLDFARPFMPENLARTEALAFLTAAQKRTLNQIRGNAYLCIFGLVEEFILPFVMDHVRPHLQQDGTRTRALLQFATEEAKHIHLFREFRSEFARGFGTDCDVIGPPEAIAAAVLKHHPLAVALTILHIEWMTQRHYIESVKDNRNLDPQFKSLLRHHWMEEAQHAKLDTLMVDAIAAGCTEEEIRKAIDEYVEIGGFLDGGLKQQTEFDLAAFEEATGRILDAVERDEFVRVQHQANRWTYIGTGMTHPNFLETVRQLDEAGRRKLEEIAPAFC